MRRYFKARQIFFDEFDQTHGIEAGALREDDEGNTNLTEISVRHCGNRSLADSRMAQQNSFHLGCGNIETLVFVAIDQTADESERSVCEHLASVSGLVPFVSGKRARCLFGLVVISNHRVVAADLDLSGLPLRQFLVGISVGNPHFDIRQRLAVCRDS